jgi:hypothetical protein
VSARARLSLILALAATLRLLRAAARWEEWAWRYSAYPGPTVDALAAGDPAAALTTWTGLHPPLWPLLHAASELLLPVPALWLLSGAALGTLGVGLVARRAPRAGLLLAVSPVALHYTAEVNDYPLLFALVCGIWVLRGEVAEGRRHWAWLALVGALAGWTHALGGLVALVAAGSLGLARGGRVLALMALAAAPLLPGLHGVLTEGGATTQPPFKAGLVLADAARRFGPGALLLAPLVALGARRAPALAAGLLLPALGLAGLVALGIAAPHQFPYLLVLAVPGALLAAAGAGGAGGRRLLLAVGLAHGAWAAIQGARDVGSIATDPGDRAIDRALADPGPGWTCAEGAPATPACAGEALILLAGGGGNDDDKTRTSPVLWRLRPWQAMPRLTAGPGDWHDHRRGHPRRVRGRAVYVFEHVRPELRDVLQTHAGARVVVYGDGPRRRFLRELQDITGEVAAPVGADHLLVLPPPR